MVEFYLKLTKSRIEGGMDKETAIAKVPAKWREAVRQALEQEMGQEESEEVEGEQEGE